MSEHYFDGLIRRLRAFDDHDTKQLDNGTLLIGACRNRQPGQLGYRNIIYAPLNDEQIAFLEVRIGRKLPAALRDAYHHANGGVLFSESFSWRGLRESNSRELGSWLTMTLEYGNTLEQPREGLPGKERHADNSNQLRFGIYIEYGVEVMVWLDGDPKVYAVPRYKLRPVLHEWSSVESFFASEVDRMIELFDKECGDVNVCKTLSAPPQVVEALALQQQNDQLKNR